ncbi:hypothetical protein AGMMS50276_11030 [Synergistales bacterium]|nr:hypothetical protein AGMMS50276_11030 [Synergistales bacterium]
MSILSMITGIFKKSEPQDAHTNAHDIDENADSLSAAHTDDAFVKPTKSLSKDAEDKKGSKKRVAALVIASVTLLLAVGAGLGIFFLRSSHHVANPDLAPPEPASKQTIELIELVRNSDVISEEVLSRLIAGGANINEPDESGVSVMKVAIALDRVEIVRSFARLPEESVILRSDNSTLIYAIVQNRPAIVREFLKVARNLSERDKNGCTLLSYTIPRNNVVIASDLIEAGADVNGRDKYGNTPLMSAASLGRPDMVSKLLELGADRNLRSLEGETALDIAKRKNRNVVISMLSNVVLVSNADIN